MLPVNLCQPVNLCLFYCNYSHLVMIEGALICHRAELSGEHSWSADGHQAYQLWKNSHSWTFPSHGPSIVSQRSVLPSSLGFVMCNVSVLFISFTMNKVAVARIPVSSFQLLFAFTFYFWCLVTLFCQPRAVSSCEWWYSSRNWRPVVYLYRTLSPHLLMFTKSIHLLNK